MSFISREFQVFVKPVGAECNLRCHYCYYLEKKDLYGGKKSPLMTAYTLEEYILQHIKASTESIINFSWHGGEPLLAGIDFYRMVVAFQQKHQPPGSEVTNGLQTNGTLLDNEWCKFFSEERFNIGISIDGPDEAQNKYRQTIEKGSALQMIVRGYDLLMKHGIIPEILCVVNSTNVKYPLEVYSFFKKLGAKYISFLPLVEHTKTLSGVSKRSVPAAEFGRFLSIIFDEWVENDIGDIKIQIFEEAARIAFNQDHTLCIFKENCGGVPVVEHTGDFYSCDHFVNAENLLGNIYDHPLVYYLESEKQKDFGLAKSLTLPQFCKVCEVRSMCNGECPKNRFIKTPDGEARLNYLCDGYKYFFNHCRPFVEAIAETWKKQLP